ncbi:hypothetical protein Pyn_37751 [Prunus yedoensis var. nudiflora]|uniref:Uncharacterized protein n=1 Tax=Prunus yedoensis var. nudiflora TaxID=2094558 RepID=A0A314Z175_PRUYE|nr:hypothetical protein Pyn_37751 [Prunus yedoensis var. nudiflora]
MEAISWVPTEAHLFNGSNFLIDMATGHNSYKQTEGYMGDVVICTDHMVESQEPKLVTFNQ